MYCIMLNARSCDLSAGLFGLNQLINIIDLIHDLRQGKKITIFLFICIFFNYM